MELNVHDWAAQQWASVQLGDQRRNQRALMIGSKMAAQPEESLPSQMGSLPELKAAYRLLSNARVAWQSLLEPHWAQTRRQAQQASVVLMIQDWTTLDYSAHPTTQGLGPIGDHRGHGLIVHSTLAVTPDDRQVLGLAYLQALIRPSQPVPRGSGRRRSAEGQAWETAAREIGAPPDGVQWVHVSDRESDVYDFLVECVVHAKHFLIRAYQNRRLEVEPDRLAAHDPTSRSLLAYIRQCAAPPAQGYTLALPTSAERAAREAQLALVWDRVRLRPPVYCADRSALSVTILRAWEPDPPADVEPIEWLLLSSLPVHNLADARRLLHWYECRWLIEDFHMCLKTGCRIERSQLDHAEDLQRLLAFAAPIAVRLLQLRQQVRHTPEALATTLVEPVMVEVLARTQHVSAVTLTLADFWAHVARLGGHLGRQRDGPPGWRTLWKGWRLLSTLTDGARLFAPPP